MEGVLIILIVKSKNLINEEEKFPTPDIEDKAKESEAKNKKPWTKPELITLDIKETEGGAVELFEDESGFTS